mgnify:CR=1 FL=1|tara:strand:- start:29 stop:502 length:474 start_codon:yes stop_codon:yes gene_type:complete
MPRSMPRNLPRKAHQSVPHAEIISKRHQKKEKKKKMNASKMKKQKLKEYLEIEKLDESQSKKTIASQLMELIEEIKDEGMNDKRYMDIMDQLMILHKQDETKIRSLDTFNEFRNRNIQFNNDIIYNIPMSPRRHERNIYEIITNNIENINNNNRVLV